VQTLGGSGKNRASFRAGFVAHGDDMREKFSRLQDIGDGPRFLLGNIDPGFLHRFHHERVQRPGFEAGAFRRKRIAADVIEPRLGHLAPGAVVNANEEDVLFHELLIAF